MEQTEGNIGYPGSISPKIVIECQEAWNFLLSPHIMGKSGKIHKFDFAFYFNGDNHLLVLGKKYSSEIRNGLAALTFFNAQGDDVGAFRKIIFCEKALSPEEKLLANALKIEVLGDVSEINYFLSTSLRQLPQLSKKKLDVGAMLSLEKEKKNEKTRKKYRDRTRLIQEVLRSASTEDGATLNNIVFKCNLNYNSARKIVDDLIKKELIGIEKNEDDKTVYRVTGDGHRVMEKMMYLEGVNSNE